MRWPEWNLSTSVIIAKAVIVSIYHPSHILGEELLFFLCVNYKTQYGELLVAVDAADKFAILIHVRASSTGDSPRLEHAELFATIGTFKSMCRRQHLWRHACSSHFRGQYHIIISLRSFIFHYVFPIFTIRAESQNYSNSVLSGMK